MSDWNPIEAKRTKYTKEELADLFKGKGTDLMRLKTDPTLDPKLYQDLRAQAVVHGIVGPSPYGAPAPYTTGKPQKSYTDRELFLRAKYSLEELTTFFRSNKSNNPRSKEETPSTLM